MATAAPAGGAYPIRFDVSYPEKLNNFLPLVKWLLAIPHFIILYLLNIVFNLVSLIAFFAILFTKRYPEGLFNFAVGARRWLLNVTAYVLLLRDEYPPFSIDPGQYPVAFEVDYPGELNRWLPLVKWLLAIPHFIIVALLSIVAFVLVIIAFFAILFTGKFPRSLFDFVVGVQRWSQRAQLYALFMTDEYPPFSMSP